MTKDVAYSPSPIEYVNFDNSAMYILKNFQYGYNNVNMQILTDFLLHMLFYFHKINCNKTLPKHAVQQ